MKASLRALIGVILLLLMVISLNERVLPQWLYILVSMLFGIILATMLWQPKQNMWYAYFLVIILAFTLWNIYAVATNFSIIPFYDSYGEYIFSRMVLENGHFTLNMHWLYSYPTPELASSYPFFSILTATLASVTGVDLLNIALFVTLVKGVVPLLFIALFVKSLSNNISNKSTVLFLALLFFAVSPDAIYNTMHFYHRHYSLSLCFMMLYFLVKVFCSERPNMKFAGLLVFLALILPLSYSYFPSVYISFLLWFTVFVYVTRLLIKPKFVRAARPPLFIFLMIFAVGFVWNYITIYPNTLTNAIRRYVVYLLDPTLRFPEVEKYGQTNLVSIPNFLMPEPFTYFLQLRDILVWAPSLVCFVVLVYRFVIKKDRDAKVLFLLCSTASFAPLAIINLFGGRETLLWRFYAMPLIIYFAATLYAPVFKNRRSIAKAFTLVLVVFMVSMSFLSLYSHVYFPRHIYDPSIEFKAVGHPSPAYINLKSFVAEHPLGNGYLLSDYPYLLFLIMPSEDYKLIAPATEHFGEPNTYVIEFIGLKTPLGYVSPGYIQWWTDARSEICIEYNKLLDDGPYTIYYKEG